MSRIKRSKLFKSILLALAYIFVCLDISNAFIHSHAMPANYTLATPSVSQRVPVTEHTAQFQRSVFLRGALIASVYEIAEYFFGNTDKNMKPLPAKYAQQVIKSYVEKHLTDEGIEILNIVPVEYIKKTSPEKLKSALRAIGFKGTLPEEGVVFILYKKSGKKFLIQLTRKNGVPTKNLPGYEWTISDRYLVKCIPENYVFQSKREAQSAKGTVLVTGGAGYIGSHTVRKLLKEDYDVVILDNLIKGRQFAVDRNKDFAEKSGRNLVFERGDLGDKNFLKEVFSRNNITAVIHFAAFIEVGESVAKPAAYFKNNIINTINLLDAMKDAGVEKIVFSSSAAVYGNPKEVPIPEDAETNPINPYGYTKLAMEKMIRYYREKFGIKWIAFRYFNASGASSDGDLGESHSPESHLIPLTIDMISQGKKMKAFGTDYETRDGTCVRDYISVEDLASAHVLALAADEKALNRVYNLGTGSGLTVKEIIENVGRLLGVAVEWIDAGRRPGDPHSLTAVSGAFKAATGWSLSASSIDTIISSAITWFRNRPPEAKESKPLPVLDESMIAQEVEDSVMENNVISPELKTEISTELFRLIEAAQMNKDFRQFEVEGAVGSLIALARKAKKENQKLIIGLETDWIPGINVKNSLQCQAIAALIKEIDNIGHALKSKGLDNVEVVRGSGTQLADAVLNKAGKMQTKMHNIIVMASTNTINSDGFASLRNADADDRPFLAGIDARELIEFYAKFGEVTSKQLHIQLTQMLYIALGLATGKEPPQLPTVVSYDKKMRVIVFLPKAEPKDYEDLKNTYAAEKAALSAA